MTVPLADSRLSGRLEEAKLAGEVSEHILRRAPAAAPVAAPADDCIPEERLSQTRFSSQDSLAA